MRRQHILVVEDHKSMSRAIKSILESEGYQVTTATDGMEALEVMRRAIPDLILADIMMPRMDGYTLYERVRARAEWIPIPFVFLTAKSEREDKLKGKELGAEDYITKPFDAEELIVSVRSRLGRARAIERASEATFEQLKEQIVTVLGHELRTPLTYVTGYTDLALEDVASLTPEETEDFLQGIKAGADRLNRLVEDLLLLVQIDSGRAREEFDTLVSRYTNLGEIVRRTAKQFESVASDRDVSVEVEVAPDVPPVRLCEAYFSDALGRLIENGIKFSRNEAREVRIGVGSGEKWIKVSVSDDGVGIPTDQQEHLFERFRQINRNQLEQQGAGLGLAIAQQLIHLHGGDITVESASGEGSTFTILLPRD
ncbi:MAG: hybrid sensor histidine kinase/response regulator [Anaerolineae bacterium]|jgi:signal transduction histidine kinase